VFKRRRDKTLLAQAMEVSRLGPAVPPSDPDDVRARMRTRKMWIFCVCLAAVVGAVAIGTGALVLIIRLSE